RDGVVGLDRATLDLEPQVFIERAFALLAALNHAPGHVRVDHHRAHDAAAVLDRRGGPDEVGLADRIDDGALFAVRRAADEIGGRLDADATREIGPAAAGDRLAPAEHLHHVELVFAAALIEEVLQGVSTSEQSFRAHAAGELAGEPERGAAEVLVVRV